MYYVIIHFIIKQGCFDQYLVLFNENTDLYVMLLSLSLE